MAAIIYGFGAGVGCGVKKRNKVVDEDGKRGLDVEDPDAADAAIGNVEEQPQEQEDVLQSDEPGPPNSTRSIPAEQPQEQESIPESEVPSSTRSISTPPANEEQV
eukprot:Awhi_evm1s248